MMKKLQNTKALPSSLSKKGIYLLLHKGNYVSYNNYDFDCHSRVGYYVSISYSLYYFLETRNINGYKCSLLLVQHTFSLLYLRNGGYIMNVNVPILAHTL